jgi:hypothetical protein
MNPSQQRIKENQYTLHCRDYISRGSSTISFCVFAVVEIKPRFLHMLGSTSQTHPLLVFVATPSLHVWRMDHGEEGRGTYHGICSLIKYPE